MIFRLTITMSAYVFSLVFFIAALSALSASAAFVPVNASCTVTAYDQVSSAISSCMYITLGSFVVPGGTTLSLKLQTGATVYVGGVITFEYFEWTGPLVEVSGSKVTFLAAGGYFDGEGFKYWDGYGDHGKVKPKFFRIKTKNGSNFNGLFLKNCPRQCVSINSAHDTTLDGFNIDVSAGDALGKNTDGFDISSSTDITIKNSIVRNQDDCIAVNQGSNFLFQNMLCIGGHGLSLSVGQSSANGDPNTVRNVTFADTSVQNSLNGIHVKTHTDAGTGSVSDVTYRNIQLSNIQNYGINIQEDYANGGSTGQPNNNIPVSNLNLQWITGSMTGQAGSMSVYIFCAYGGCNTWNWTGIYISNSAVSNNCNFTPNGFFC